MRSTASWQAILTTGAGLALGGATTVFVGWLLRKPITRSLAGHAVGLTIPWRSLTAIAAICMGLALIAARASTRVSSSSG